MDKAWAFYRRSTDKQELSLEDQRAACKKYADEHGWLIIKEFTPAKGFASGLSIDKDESFLEMLRLSKEPHPGVKYLLIYDVSRFGRLAPREKIFWEETFHHNGIRIIYATEHFTNDNSLGDDLTQYISHSEAHMYSVRLSKSTIRGSKSHALLGHSCGGAAPYGYARMLTDATGKHLQLLGKGVHKADKMQHVVWVIGDKKEVETVKDIFSMFANGNGLGSIVDYLNGQDIPSPTGGTWSKNTLSVMLKNPVYVGTRVYFKHNYHDRSSIQPKHVRSKEEWVTKENAHPAIIDKELFDKVQERFTLRKGRDGRHYDSPHLLSGFLYCTHCGHRYFGQYKYHKGLKVPNYICGGYHNKGKHICSSFSVAANKLDTAVINHIRLYDYKQAADAFLTAMCEAVGQPGAPAANPGLKALEIELAKKKGEMKNLVDAVRLGHSSEAVLTALDAAEQQVRDIEARLAKERGEAPAKPVTPQELVQSAGRIMQDIPMLLSSERVEEKKTLLRSFVHHVDIDRATQEAKFYFYTLPINEKAAGQLLSGGSHGILKNYCGGWI